MSLPISYQNISISAGGLLRRKLFDVRDYNKRTSNNPSFLCLYLFAVFTGSSLPCNSNQHRFKDDFLSTRVLYDCLGNLFQYLHFELLMFHFKIFYDQPDCHWLCYNLIVAKFWEKVLDRNSSSDMIGSCMFYSRPRLPDVKFLKKSPSCLLWVFHSKGFRDFLSWFRHWVCPIQVHFFFLMWTSLHMPCFRP